MGGDPSRRRLGKRRRGMPKWLNGENILRGALVLFVLGGIFGFLYWTKIDSATRQRERKIVSVAPRTVAPSTATPSPQSADAPARQEALRTPTPPSEDSSIPDARPIALHIAGLTSGIDESSEGG